ncbi:hypothetical protein RRG08_003712 [Elysia crispata]|uniref:Uncharacterized protein n=1 Tax=Elysia crispata TaxID=231223 RepID=A0AAE1E6E8_9GAST|nr:hypothetical protein RRG08_003712 [Elysia crispata]
MVYITKDKGSRIEALLVGVDLTNGWLLSHEAGAARYCPALGLQSPRGVATSWPDNLKFLTQRGLVCSSSAGLGLLYPAMTQQIHQHTNKQNTQFYALKTGLSEFTLNHTRRWTAPCLGPR